MEQEGEKGGLHNKSIPFVSCLSKLHMFRHERTSGGHIIASNVRGTDPGIGFNPGRGIVPKGCSILAKSCEHNVEMGDAMSTMQ